MISDFFNKIYYCICNASSSNIMKLLNNNRETLKDTIAFDKMFDLNGNPYSQSKLLVIGNISCEKSDNHELNPNLYDDLSFCEIESSEVKKLCH